jgi:hypothetical protein
VRADPRLELLSPAGLGVVCLRRRFEHTADEDELAALNAALVAGLEATGEALVSSTRLRGRYAIRLCALNHTSAPEDVEWVLEWLASAPVPDLPAPPPHPRRDSTIADAAPAGDAPFDLEAVARIPLFAELEVAAAARLAGAARERRARPGEVVVRRDQLERDFYVVVDGALSVHIGGDHVRDLGPGDFFGELAALDWGAGYGYARTATVTAAEPARLLVLPPRELRALMRSAPSVARRVEAAARERLQRT